MNLLNLSTCLFTVKPTHSFELPILYRIGKHRIRRKVLLCHSWVGGVCHLEIRRKSVLSLCVCVWCLTYLLVAVKVVLVIGGHAGVGVVPTGGGGLAGVEASHHPGVEI